MFCAGFPEQGPLNVAQAILKPRETGSSNSETLLSLKGGETKRTRFFELGVVNSVGFQELHHVRILRFGRGSVPFFGLGTPNWRVPYFETNPIIRTNKLLLKLTPISSGNRRKFLGSKIQISASQLNQPPTIRIYGVSVFPTWASTVPTLFSSLLRSAHSRRRAEEGRAASGLQSPAAARPGLPT